MARYDEFAEWYDEWVGDDVTEPCAAAVLDTIGDVRGQRLLDLGCGSGRLTRALAARGARVVGIDISSKLIERAEAHDTERPLAVSYVVADAASTAWHGMEPFDGVVSNMALMDIDDLEGTFASVASTLASDGWFVFSVFLPCFPGSGARRRGRVGIHHRTLSTYLNALIDAGFALTKFVEPAATEDDGAPIPTPFWLVVSARLEPDRGLR